METIFDSFREGSILRGSYEPGDPESYQQYIHALIQDSRDYEGSTLAPRRDENQKYYYGYLPSLNPDGSPFNETLIVDDPNATFGDILGDTTEDINKSSYVSTDVRDAILLILPALIRIFAASENVVSLVPRTQAAVDMADQATDYVNFTFWQDNPGFLLLYGCFKDALTVCGGFIKWWTDTNPEIKIKTFENINEQQIQLILMQDSKAEVISAEPNSNGLYDVTFKSKVSKPVIKIEGVPPEEMRLDRYARSFSKSRLTGHERIVAVDQLTAMGYPRDLCMDFLQSQEIRTFTQEPQLRNPGRYMSTRVGDGVLYGEYYIWLDTDGDGVAELRYICTMGESHQIVNDKPANRVKYAYFGVDPRSHTIIGDCVADLAKDFQKIKTNMMRGVLDSLAQSINPKTVINELTVNIDDALNDDLGAVIRTRGDVNNAIAFNNIPFLGQQALPIIDMLDVALSRRTGLSDAAKGLDPKALQSSTQIGVEAVINGAQERIELIARILAETGYKDLFKGLFDEICENPNQERTLQIRDKWVQYATGMFDADMGVCVNPTMGKGSDVMRLMTLQQIKQDQVAVYNMLGPKNPIVTPQHMMNTQSDILNLSNIKNVNRYFSPPPPEWIQAVQQTPTEPGAADVAAKAMMEKVRSSTAIAVSDHHQAQLKQEFDQEYKRAQLAQKTATDEEKARLEAVKLATDHMTDMATINADLEKARIAAEAKKANGSGP